MRKLLLLLAWLSLSVVSYTQTLVAYYPFNGNANDQSGNNINPTYTGAGVTLTTDRFGNANKAYNFDGAIGSYLRMNADLLPTTNRTISLWFNVPDVSNRPGILGYGGNGCGTTLLMGLNLLGAGQYYVQGHCGNNAAGYAYPAAPVNNWYHWVLTINGSAQKIYVNGQLKSTDNTFGISTVVTGKDFSLGVITSTSGTAPYTDANVGYLNGKLDDIRIYDNAMTDAQVLQLYQSESTGMVAYYPFNGNANDESGNGNNGIVNGATLTTDRYGNANKAYSFTNPNHISVLNSNMFGDEFTVSYWFKIGSYFGQRGVMSNVAVPNGGFQQAFDGTTFSYILGYNFPQTGDPLYSNYTMQEPLSQWHHLAVTYKKTGTTQSESQLFINGELKKSSNHIGLSILFTPNATFYIGQNHSGLNFQGDLDDIKIYNRNLSPNEIAQHADKPFMPDLLAYLPMNGDANDKSGNGRNGTVVNAPPATDKYDNANSAYQFNGNGTGTSITLANSTSLDFYENFGGRPFSLSAWVNLGTNTGEPRQIIGKHNCGTPNGYMLLVENGKLGFWMSVSGTWFPLTSTETYNDGKWHHVIATYDVTYQRLYIDGVLKGSMLTAYNNPAYGAPIKIGEPSNCGGLGLFSGKVDEVKIYGSSLNAAQVTALFKQSRGSSNALLFKGNSTNHVLLPGPIAAPPAFFLEAWVKRNAVQTWQWLFSGMETNSWEWGLNGSLMVFGKLNAGAVVLSSPIAIDDNKWHHLALTYDGGPGTVSFYVDGMAAGTGTISASGSVPGTYAIGNRPGGSTESFDGYIDEFRIGGSARDINAIRNWMCRKPTTDGFSELGFHFNFDEQTINDAYDVEGGSKSLLIDGPQYVTSGAPIGDVSVANYSNPNTHGTILSLSSGEQFEVFDPVWGLTGVNIYVVKDPPETQVGILGLGTNDHYFGVHINSGGNPVSYTARYNYTGNPFVSTSTEPTLQLFKRADNSATNWANSGATLNTTANTLTVTGQNTEYILGSSGFGLPVTLLSFEAKKINATTTLLNWKTSQEINNKGFEIQRSFDGSYFVNIGFVHGAGNSDIMKEYSTTDIPGKTGRVYYRLKQVDFDEQSKLSQIVSVLFDSQGIIKVYPNPAQQQVTIEGVEQYMRVQLLEAAGKMVKEQLNNGQYLLNMSLDGLKSGMYLLRLINGKDNYTIKLMIGN